MAEQGKALLLKRGATTVAGIRSRNININGETVDVTSDDSSGWRELLAAAGVTSISVGGSGVVTNNADAKTMVGDATGMLLQTYSVVVPGIGTFTGSFQLTQMEFAGEHNGEATYNIALESSDSITFTPVV